MSEEGRRVYGMDTVYGDEWRIVDYLNVPLPKEKGEVTVVMAIRQENPSVDFALNLVKKDAENRGLILQNFIEIGKFDKIKGCREITYSANYLSMNLGENIFGEELKKFEKESPNLLAPDSTVNHPTHYNKGKIEVIDFIEDQKLGFHLGNVVKYICREGKSKNKIERLEDLKKAQWYLDRYIEKG